MKPGWPLVGALAAAQLVSWGTVYYGFSLFVVPMERELGWSLASLNGALSLGLLVSGLAAYPVGRWIDRRGGRLVMSLGSALAAALLALWASVGSLAVFYLLWVGLGLALATTLYDPVFAVLTRLFPESYGRRITVLSLVGGFASTVFIPLTALAIDRLGWRPAVLLLALANLAIPLPIHLFLLRDAPVRAPATRSAPRSDDAVRRALVHRAFWGLALCFTAYYATFSALTFHIVPLLTERGVPIATMIGAIAVVGPAQVAGRIALLALGRRATAALSGRCAFIAFPLSIVLLIAFPASTAALFLFAALYGAANGVVTIVRGTAVPELLWRESYGAINGALTLPANVARGAAPFGAALVWSAAGGYDAVLWAILLGGCVAAAGFAYACARAERR